MLSDSLRELMSEDVFPEALEATAQNPDLSQQLLFEIYREYLDYLERNGLMDSAQIPTRTRELIEGKKIYIKDEKFAFIGFLSFTNAQKNLIESMSNNGAVVKLIQPEAFVEGVYDASAQFIKYKIDNENAFFSLRGHVNHHRNYYLYETPDLLCELDLLARELALWSKKSGAFEEQDFKGWDSIAILTSPERIRALHGALSRYSIPVNLHTGKKISETPLGYLPKKIFNAYKNGWQAKETAMLLAHACLGGSISESEMMYRGPVGESNWMKLMSDRQNSVGIKAFEAMTKFCRAINKGGVPVALLKALYEFTRKSGLWLDSLRHFVIEDYSGKFDPELRELSSAIIELERKLLFMKELQPSIGNAGNQILKGYAAMEFLDQWAEESQTSTNPYISGAVSVYSRIPSLAYFDTLIITGVTAKEWPGNLLSLSIISEQMRERVNEYAAPDSKPTHLTTLHEKRIQKEALLKRLFYSAERFVVISRPLADGKNRPLLESPCLISAFGSKDFVNVGTIRKAFSDLLPKDSPYFYEIEIDFDRAGKKKDAPAASGENNNIVRISTLDELVECPYLYWARYIKRIKEPVNELYNNAFAGNLVHDILEAAWKKKLSSYDDLSQIVSSLWEELENNSGGDYLSVYKDLFTDKRLVRRKNLLRSRIMKTAELQDEIEERMNSRTDKRTDIKFEHEVSFEMGGLSFTGRCDRLDIFRDGVVIIDYKTGKAPSSMLQLGSYAKALKMNGMEIMGAGYISLVDEKFFGVLNGHYSMIYTGRETKKSVEELLNDTEQGISSAVQVLKSGEYKPNYDSALCRYCSYKPICRYAEFRDETDL
ncbi:MAG: PD-(D/E)XK nuclease family protein, partial [Synergistaceae bacterium]|nr:PD-(D/E)XK nuclease family protein [Synergistaceae bacterium]